MAYNVGDSVKGTVSGITAFGAFVKLESGGNGMIHISKLSKGFVTDVSSIVQIGDEVTATVIGVNGEKIALSLIGDKKPDTAPSRKNKKLPADDFEAMLSSFKSASDDRLSGLPSGNSRGHNRDRRRK